MNPFILSLCLALPLTALAAETFMTPAVFVPVKALAQPTYAVVPGFATPAPTGWVVATPLPSVPKANIASVSPVPVPLPSAAAPLSPPARVQAHRRHRAHAKRSPSPGNAGATLPLPSAAAPLSHTARVHAHRRHRAHAKRSPSLGNAGATLP